MLEYLAVQVVEIVVGIIVVLIFLGGSGAYIAYRVWAKKHGKSACDGNCAHCSGCHINTPYADNQLQYKIEKSDVPDSKMSDKLNSSVDSESDTNDDENDNIRL